MINSLFPAFKLTGLVLILALLGSCKSKTALQATSSPVSKSALPGPDSLANYPYWIAMMENPASNYYQAVAAFDAFWAHREKPTENDGEGKDIYGRDKSVQEKEKEAHRSIEYVYEYKQFLNWMERNKNIVKPDGSIPTPQEIMEQSKKERGLK